MIYEEHREVRCADCGADLSDLLGLPSWSHVPGDDVRLDRADLWGDSTPRHFVCAGCYDPKRHVLYAGLPTSGWRLVKPSPADRSYGSCRFCGDRGWLRGGFCCPGCRSGAETPSLTHSSPKTPA